MPGQDHRQPRFGLDEAVISLQGHAHAGRHPVGDQVAQDDAIERQPDRIRDRAVDIDDPTLNRSVIAVSQDRF